MFRLHYDCWSRNISGRISVMVKRLHSVKLRSTMTVTGTFFVNWNCMHTFCTCFLLNTPCKHLPEWKTSLISPIPASSGAKRKIFMIEWNFRLVVSYFASLFLSPHISRPRRESNLSRTSWYTYDWFTLKTRGKCTCMRRAVHLTEWKYATDESTQFQRTFPQAQSRAKAKFQNYLFVCVTFASFFPSRGIELVRIRPYVGISMNMRQWHAQI